MFDSVRCSDLSLSSFTSTILSYLIQTYYNSTSFAKNTWEPASMRREVEWHLIPSSSPQGTSTGWEPWQDYAILSGGNILGLKEEAVPELRRVFSWARRWVKGKYGLRDFESAPIFESPKITNQKILAYIESTPTKNGWLPGWKIWPKNLFGR